MDGTKGQIQKDKYYMLSLLCGIYTLKIKRMIRSVKWRLEKVGGEEYKTRGEGDMT
jgi:hypothetical protein